MVENTKKELGVDQFIDQLKITGLQKFVVTLCFIIAAIEGFDLAAIGFLAPAILEAFQLSPPQLAPLFLSTLFGVMVGSVVCGPLGDKFGRKPLLIASVVFFSVASIMSGYAATLSTLIFWSFLKGVGVGGAMPSAVATVSEYCPNKHRSKLVIVMFCGYTLGAAIGGLAIGQLIPNIGWEGVLILGGVLPLALVPVLFLALPESLRFLVTKNAAQDKIDRIVTKLVPNPADRPSKLLPPALSDSENKKVSVTVLFSKQYILGTICLWTSFVMGTMIIYMVSSWMPTILKADGYTVQHASYMTSAFQFGGTAGALIIAYFMDKMTPSRVLATAYIVGALSVFLLYQGIFQVNTVLIIVGIFIIGFAISGAQSGLFAITSGFYPTHCRVTGIAWASAFGRIGSLIGSTVVGWLMVSGMSTAEIVGLLAIPATLTAVSMIIMTKFVMAKRQAAAQVNASVDAA